MGSDVATGGALAAMETLPFGRFHHVVLALVCLRFGCLCSAVDVFPLLFPPLAVDWHLTDVGLAVLSASVEVGKLIGSLLGGRMADHSGRLAVLRVATVMSAVLSLLQARIAPLPVVNATPALCDGQACAPTPWLMGLVRLCMGISMGAEIAVLPNALVEVLSVSARGYCLTIVGVGCPLGILVASSIASHCSSGLGDEGMGWRSGVLLAAIPLSLWLPALRVLPESPRYLMLYKRHAEAAEVVRRAHRWCGVKCPDQLCAEPGSKTPPTHPVPAPSTQQQQQQQQSQEAGWRVLISPPLVGTTVAVMGMWLALGGASYGVRSWLPVVILRRANLHKLPFVAIAGMVCCDAVGRAIVAPLTIDRLGRRSLLRASFVLSAVGVVCSQACATVNAMAMWGGLHHMAQAIIWQCLLAYTTEVFSLACCGGGDSGGAQVFPTSLRATATGAGYGFARMGSVMLPTVGAALMERGSGIAMPFFASVYATGVLFSSALTVETTGRELREMDLGD